MKLKKLMQLSAIVVLICMAVLWLTSTETPLTVDGQTSKQTVQEPKVSAAATSITQNVNQEQNPAQQQACLTTVATEHLDEHWYQSTRENIDQYILSLAKQSITKPTMNELLIDSGIDVSQSFELIYSESVSESSTLIQNTPHTTSQEYQLFNQLIDDKNYNGILLAYQQQRLPTKKQFFVGRELYTPLGLFFELSKKQSVDDEQIELSTSVSQLLQAGVPVRLSDLATATASGFSVQMLVMLSDYLPIDADKSFRYEHDFHTLVTLAIANEQVDAAQFWVSQNIHAEAKRYKDNALDMIATMGVTAKPDHYTSLLTALLDSGLTTNNPDSYDHFTRWLPAELLQKYQSQLNNFSAHIQTDEQRAFIVASRTDIAGLALGGLLSSVEINQLAEHNRACLFVISKNLTEQVYKRSKTASQLRYEIELPPERPTVAELEAQKLTSDEIIAALGQYIDINGKHTASRYIEGLAQKVKRRQVSRKVWHLTLGGDWLQALEQHEVEHDKQLDKQQKLNLSFWLAFRANAKTEILVKLVEQGAEVSPDLLSNIIFRGDVALITALYQNDFNIHFKLSDGDNAVSLAVKLRKRSMLTFLLDHGVSVKPFPYGFDPLDYAIMRLGTEPLNLDYLDLLINAGAPIEPSHKQLVQSYAEQSYNDNLYDRLINKFPQLSN